MTVPLRRAQRRTILTARLPHHSVIFLLATTDEAADALSAQFSRAGSLSDPPRLVVPVSDRDLVARPVGQRCRSQFPRIGAQNGLRRCSFYSWDSARPIRVAVGNVVAGRFPRPRHYARASQQLLTRPRSPTAETSALNTVDTGSNPVAGTFPGSQLAAGPHNHRDQVTLAHLDGQ